MILDPGLNELGGHHPATLASIKSAVVERENFDIQVYCHQACSPDFMSEQQAKQVQCFPHFKTHYYSFFYGKPSYTELTEYTLVLAKEYQQAILEVLETTEDSTAILFWCHTLNWEHATALALALTNVTRKITPAQCERFMVNVGLMYHPMSRASTDELGVLQHTMRHELAFKRLAELERVRLFAADQEIQQFYQKRFNYPVGIQPCLLLGATAAYDDCLTESCDIQDSEHSEQIILFIGDAKENKGFSELPQLIKKIVPASPHKKFVVQYSNTGVASELLAVDNDVKRLSKVYPNLELINRFLTHQDLMALFKSSQTVVLNYDETTYKYQSSGVLWLAAFFPLKVISLSHTWMSREAVRLGVDYRECQTYEQCASVVNSNPKACLINQQEYEGLVRERNKVQTNYFNEMFMDVNEWLDIQLCSGFVKLINYNIERI
ncbi:hypothetical protein [Shewanella sp. 6_MG-2023]|uniref:hypothetical protein n=1 Tax=Shewanella sp. 6_MG-2023 TaxID=3062660 RepID=UPI0026E425A8|nr:hypothetical protein [Shewanella sp. 6_MG-2023]MDO6617609.1 hypothetical protein [Shewanella sp. 6_MG-2023]